MEYFKFEDEFKDSLEMFTIPYTGEGDGIRGIVSFDPPTTESDHIIEKDGIGKVVTTSGGVLLGKMSFQMTADTFDASWFQLVEDSEDSPKTGIKINIDGTNYYEAQSTFRFTDKTASKDASLSNLVVSSGIVDETNPDNSTYKEYTLTPTFDKETLNYEITLLEYLDTIDIKATQNHEKATMKIKVPKRNEDGNLVYEIDGTTITYEEKDLTNDIPFEVTINKLGEPDTNITIIVTAEDGTINNYELVIKRPYGTIKGSIYTEPTKNTTMKNEAYVKVYASEQTETIINWTDALAGNADDTNEKLNTLVPIAGEYKTNDDGTYEIKVIPGKYDILIDKAGYLDQIYINVTIAQNTSKDLENVTLIPGDINKDGIIEILDKVIMTKQNGKTSTDVDFNESGDLNDDGAIEILDKTILTKNNGQKRNIINFGGENS